MIDWETQKKIRERVSTNNGIDWVIILACVVSTAIMFFVLYTIVMEG